MNSYETKFALDQNVWIKNTSEWDWRGDEIPFDNGYRLPFTRDIPFEQLFRQESIYQVTISLGKCDHLIITYNFNIHEEDIYETFDQVKEKFYAKYLAIADRPVVPKLPDILENLGFKLLKDYAFKWVMKSESIYYHADIQFTVNGLFLTLYGVIPGEDFITAKLQVDEVNSNTQTLIAEKILEIHGEFVKGKTDDKH